MSDTTQPKAGIYARSPTPITPAERKRVVAVAGARPAQGVPLTRWSLDRLSVYLTEHELVISPIHLWRLLAQTGLSSERIRSWKASPDPAYEAEAVRILELYEVAPLEGPVINFDQMDRSAT